MNFFEVVGVVTTTVFGIGVAGLVYQLSAAIVGGYIGQIRIRNINKRYGFVPSMNEFEYRLRLIPWSIKNCLDVNGWTTDINGLRVPLNGFKKIKRIRFRER